MFALRVTVKDFLTCTNFDVCQTCPSIRREIQEVRSLRSTRLGWGGEFYGTNFEVYKLTLDEEGEFWGLQELSLGRREILRHRLWGPQDLVEEVDFEVQASRSSRVVLGWGERSWGIGRFREAGLHEWMPFVISRPKSRKRLQLSLPGQFLSRLFMLCITMEDEPRIAKQYKCHHCCSCKNYWGKGMEGGKKKCFCIIFLADQKIASSWKKNVFLAIL